MRDSVEMSRNEISGVASVIGFLSFVCLFFTSCSPKAVIIDLNKAQHFAGLGSQFLQEREFSKAEAAFRLSLEYATTALALDGLGCVALQQGQVHDAKEYLLQAVEEDPTYAGAYGNLALVYETEGALQEAHKHFSLALSLDPGDFRTRNNFAAFLHDNKVEKEFIRNLLLEAVVSSVSPEHTRVIQDNLYLLENRHD